MSAELIIHIDGGARGNPGPAGAGVVIRGADGTRLHEAGYFLGRQTNNAAEYQALLRALQRAQRFEPAPQRITLFSDSELLVRQITGAYQVKAAGLIALHEEAQMLLLRVPRWSVRHVRREENRRADELANLAMDRKADVVVFDVEQAASGAAPPDATRPEHVAIGEDEPGLSQAGESADPAAEPLPTTPAARKQPSGPMQVPAGYRPAVQVRVVRPSGPAECVAGGLPQQTFVIESQLPAGLCLHAAHALLPTVLAILSTEPHEFAAIPTLTLRCGHAGCPAVFQLSPLRGGGGGNGANGKAGAS